MTRQGAEHSTHLVHTGGMVTLSSPATVSRTSLALSRSGPAPVHRSPSPAVEHDPAICRHCIAAAEADTAASPLLRPPPFLPNLTLRSSASALIPQTPPSPTTIEHRRSDACRRQRERTAIDRLDELLSAGAEAEQSPTDSSDAATDATFARRKRKRDKRDKLSVLEGCAARIERLVQLLSEAERSNETLSAEISGLFARERQSAQWLDASRALDSAGLLSDRFVSVQLEAHTGRLLYANAGFFTVTGFTPGGVLQRVMSCIDSSSPSGVGPHQAGLDHPLVRAPPGRANSGKRGGDSESSKWVTKPVCKQYPRTTALFGELFAGERVAFRAWPRCYFADGKEYEIECDFWTVEAEWVEGADGRRWRRPVTYAGMASVDDIVEVGSV